MKKTLLILGAALASSIITSQAQVYSQNVVGYVNLVVPSGYSCVGNALDSDGTGTNNWVSTVFSTNSLPVGSQVLGWNGANFVVSTLYIPRHATTPVWDVDQPFNPGSGSFIYNPSNSPVTVVLTGQVLQGNLTNSAIYNGGGYYLVSSQIPIAGDLVTNLNYIPSPNDQILTWNAGNQSYDIANYYLPRHASTYVWDVGNAPQISVGQGFFLFTTNTSPAWTNNFTVQ